METLLPLKRLLPALALPLVVAACGGGDEPESTTFVFRLHGHPETQEFRATTDSPEVIAAARAQLALPVEERRLFPNGPIAAGSGGVNAPWSWHYENFELAEMTIELCDGWPGLVESDLPYWLNTVKTFCPWSGYVHAEAD
mgnify:CR=1 FL=1